MKIFGSVGDGKSSAVLGGGASTGTVLSGKAVSGRSRMAKFLVMALVLCAVFASPIFAADGDTIAVLDSMGDKIINLINARWLKALLALALCIEFGVIAFGNAQGEGGMIKKVLPWVIGTAGILGATSIVGFFFKGQKASASDYLGSYVIDNAKALGALVAPGLFPLG